MSADLFTLDDLRRILTEGAGESTPIDDASLDREFADLGYDSLALLETGSRIDREFGLSLDDGALAEVTTPRTLIDLVNTELSTAHA